MNSPSQVWLDRPSMSMNACRSRRATCVGPKLVKRGPKAQLPIWEIPIRARSTKRFPAIEQVQMKFPKSWGKPTKLRWILRAQGILGGYRGAAWQKNCVRCCAAMICEWLIDGSVAQDVRYTERLCSVDQIRWLVSVRRCGSGVVISPLRKPTKWICLSREFSQSSNELED